MQKLYQRKAKISLFFLVWLTFSFCCFFRIKFQNLLCWISAEEEEEEEEFSFLSQETSWGLSRPAVSSAGRIRYDVQSQLYFLRIGSVCLCWWGETFSPRESLTQKRMLEETSATDSSGMLGNGQTPPPPSQERANVYLLYLDLHTASCLPKIEPQSTARINLIYF